MRVSTKRLKARVREPSTWAGVAAIGAVVAGMPPQAAAQIAAGGGDWQQLATVLIPALFAIFLPERGGKDRP